MRILFSGNKKVVAEFGGFRVLTDQPKDGGGDGEAPAPFELFLASIGTCAGLFALSFCRKREIPTEGLELIQDVEWDETRHRVSKISLTIALPPDFPEKYQDSLVAAVNLCTVKKHLLEPPAFEIRALKPAAPR